MKYNTLIDRENRLYDIQYNQGQGEQIIWNTIQSGTGRIDYMKYNTIRDRENRLYDIQQTQGQGE